MGDGAAGDDRAGRPGTTGDDRAGRGGGLLVGITTPVVTTLPQAHAGWERQGTIADLAMIAQAAERLGYSHLTCSEHVVVPASEAPVRGARYWDPLATFGYLAARTDRIRFATNVLVLGYHHPLEIAKRYGTLDQVCGGRVVLGLGVGSLREEFELLGVPFDDRGARADDALRALRAAWGRSEPEYEGPYYRFAGMVVDPCATSTEVPFWIGGRTARSLRRAIELGDGWMPFGLRPEEIGEMLARAEQAPTWAARPAPLEVLLQTGRPVDPVGDPEGTRRIIGRLVEAGATGLQLRFVHHSPGHFVEQLEGLAGLVDFRPVVAR